MHMYTHDPPTPSQGPSSLARFWHGFGGELADFGEPRGAVRIESCGSHPPMKKTGVSTRVAVLCLMQPLRECSSGVFNKVNRSEERRVGKECRSRL